MSHEPPILTTSRSVDSLIERLRHGEPRALARAITEIENATTTAPQILDAVRRHPGSARVVGVTGPPGVGKSTLIDVMISELRRRELRVAVLAVDPSSPLTGGAILGDRIRMTSHIDDPGVFVRSLASRGHLGGLSRTAGGVVRLLNASGVDIVIVETVGAGQSEVDIADLASIRVVVWTSGLGDDIQAMKAGILEIADVLVVNKSDQPGAEQTAHDLRQMLALRTSSTPKTTVVATSATTGDGVAALVDVFLSSDVRDRAAASNGSPLGRRRLADAAADQVREAVLASAAADALSERVHASELSLAEAATQMLDDLSPSPTLAHERPNP
jgi:LAO/AO transport system kinase